MKSPGKQVLTEKRPKDWVGHFNIKQLAASNESILGLMLITSKPSTVSWEMLCSNEWRPDMPEAVTMARMIGISQVQAN